MNFKYPNKQHKSFNYRGCNMQLTSIKSVAWPYFDLFHNINHRAKISSEWEIAQWFLLCSVWFMLNTTVLRITSDAIGEHQKRVFAMEWDRWLNYSVWLLEIAANGSQSQSVGAICGIVCVPCWFYWGSVSIWIQI